MAAGDPHTFRFFVDVAGAVGVRAALTRTDARHCKVLRLTAGDDVEVVDASGAVWLAHFVEGGEVRLIEWLERGRTSDVEIELVAGILLGGPFDTLVDGAVQTGATRIVPYSDAARDRTRIAKRTERLERIAASAAKQAKRGAVPTIAEPIGREELLTLRPGVVLDVGCQLRLDNTLTMTDAGPVRLLVGPAGGLDPDLLDALLDAGWIGGHLGPSILRAELAAAVAVGVVAMHVNV